MSGEELTDEEFDNNTTDEEFDDLYVVVPYPQPEDGDDVFMHAVEVQDQNWEQENAEQADEQVFDEDLPASHSYLGEMDRVSGRTVLLENSIVLLPILPGWTGTLIPGQTLPLTCNDYPRCQLIHNVIKGNRTFGCFAKVDRLPVRPKIYGTTCEIYEYSEQNGFMSVKAKARQRFKVVNIVKVEHNVSYANCQILPEVNLRKPLTSYRLPSLDRIRRSKSAKCQLREAYTSPWPVWLYKQYDADLLREKVSKDLCSLTQGLKKKENDKLPIPENPTDLSFWLASHLGPVERLFIIKENSSIRRVRWILSLSLEYQQFCCATCENMIADHKDLFAISAEGAQTTYVNPGGFLHDTLTLKTTTNLLITSSPSLEYSWFPGYAWQIAVCVTCKKHIGWKFLSKKLTPPTFWGLSRQSLTVKITKGLNDEEFVPVM